MISVLVILAAVVATGALSFVVGMRTHSPIVRGLVAMANRSRDPGELRGSAGSPGAYAGVVRHIGRRSGRELATPVGVVADGDDYLIALPYGRGTQWLRNVLAAGEATLVTDGRTVPVHRPEIIPVRGVVERFSATDRRLFRLMNTTECLRLRPNESALAA